MYKNRLELEQVQVSQVEVLYLYLYSVADTWYLYLRYK
jgi:hypothetical protein